MIARILAMLGGAVLLGAVAHVTVTSTGGYGAPHSYLTLAVAFGVACGSVFSGMAWSAGRYSLAVLFVVCIVGGEAYGVMQTANRLVAASEHTQAPLREYAREYARAKERVEAAETKAKNLPTTSSRLEKAEKAKAAAIAAVVDKSAEKGCRENCRQLLQAQVNAAAEDVDKARAELENSKREVEQELASAREALGKLEAPVSATPLADRTGIAAWVLDLITASLGSIAANGLACCLMIFGAHHSARRDNRPDTPKAKNADAVVKDVPMQDITRIDAAPLAITAQPVDGREHVARFLRSILQPNQSGESSLRQLHTRYPDWCRQQGVDLLPPVELGQHLRSIVDAIGLECVPVDRDVVIKGAVIRA
jgi:hypothetical protein